MRITLSGDLGSGKSSVGKLLAERIDAPHHSAGSLFREIGHISNLDALKTNLAAENNVAIDHAVDEATRKLDREVPDFVINSRMAWHFVHDATKVYLAVAPETAARRIMADTGRGTERYDDLAAAASGLAERRQSERKRYSHLYNVDIGDIGNYDLFVITDDAAVTDIADLILAFAKSDETAKFWLPKTRIVPMVAPGGDGADTSGPLPLTIADNFGFYSGAPGPLAAALAGDRPLVAYTPEPAADGAAVVQRALRTLRPGGLGAWTKATGVPLAFSRLLGPARP